MIISIFNGFSFHYETFCVFLYNITQHNPKAIIRLYTNQKDDFGWLTYYCDRFPISCVKPHEEFKEQDFIESTYIILTTDDDSAFPIEFMKLSGAQHKVLCYDHNIALRQPLIERHITTRSYPLCEARKDTPFLYPVYPMISINEKRETLEKETTINIAVVGGSWNTNHFWKYLLANNNMNDIKIFFIHRNNPCVWGRMDKYVKSICRYTEIYLDCETPQLLELLKRSHYLAFLTDIEQFVSHSCSGSVGMALNTGCTMLMTRKYNSEFQFKNPIYFDDCPKLSATPDLECIFNERETIIKTNYETIASLLNID
jgi:hypothetical protein